MAYWFGGFSLFGFVLLNSSAEICAGSPAPGAGFLDFFANLVPMRVIWHAWCLYLCVLGSLGRSWDDPGTLGSTRKDTVRSMLGFYRFLADLGKPFKEVFAYMWTEQIEFFIYIYIYIYIYSQAVFSDDLWV